MATPKAMLRVHDEAVPVRSAPSAGETNDGHLLYPELPGMKRRNPTSASGPTPTRSGSDVGDRGARFMHPRRSVSLTAPKSTRRLANPSSRLPSKAVEMLTSVARRTQK